MALIKPIALSVDAFDAKNPQTFYFTLEGGTQVVKNRLTIRNNLTNEIVYQNTVETFQFSQSIPSNTLENNVYYNFYFNTFDVEGNMSENSNVVQFYCYNTPTLIFDNLMDGQEINSSSYEFIITYNSVDNELLNYLEFILYDSSDNEISRSKKYYGDVIMPQTFSHKFGGFENAQYHILVKGITVNGSRISSEKLSFTVRFYYPTIYSLLDLEQKCQDGYVRILSNVVMPDHEQFPEEPKYKKTFDVRNPQDYLKWEENYNDPNNIVSVWTTETMLDVCGRNDFVKWYNGFRVTSNFKLGIWGEPSLFGEMCSFYDRNNLSNKITLSLKRNIPYDETTPKDFIELRCYENGVLKVYQRSNYVEPMNNLSSFILLVKKVGSTYTVELNVIKRGKQVFEWGNSNVEYAKLTTDIYWQGESNEKETVKPKFINESIEQIFPLDTVEVRNGVYDNLNLTKDTRGGYTNVFPTWNYDTIINCNFNGNITAGNIELTMSQLAYVKIKRRKRGAFEWVTLYKIPIEKEEDLNIVLNDSFIASGNEYDYAFVPVMPDGVEGGYITNTIKPKLYGTFISNQNKIFKIYSGYVLSSIRNQSVGALQPIGRKYPILIKNGQTDFLSGTVGGNILGYNFEETKVIDRNDIVKQVNDLEDFLTDGDAKVLSDSNGNCWVVRFNGMPNNVYNQMYGNGIVSFSDTWVQQGDVDDQKSLYENGLVKDIE